MKVLVLLLAALAVCAAMDVSDVYDDANVLDLLQEDLTADTSSCPNGCTGKGICDKGRCYCQPGYGGEDCSLPIPCKESCNYHGECRNGICFCYNGFKGESCGEVAEAEEAGPFKSELRELVEERVGDWYRKYLHREPDNGGLESWVNAVLTGKHTLHEVRDLIRKSEEAQQCLNNCSGHGECKDGLCTCYTGFAGTDCSAIVCPNDCSGRGSCDGNSTCHCNPGFTGDDCSLWACPNDCSGHGSCSQDEESAGKCACDEGFGGDDCALVKCPNDCTGHGECMEGVCSCNPGWTGDDCAVVDCPHNCSDHGSCNAGACECFFGFEGKACDKKINFAMHFDAKERQYLMVNFGNRSALEQFGDYTPLTVEAWVRFQYPITCKDVDWVIVDQWRGSHSQDLSVYRLFVNGCNDLDGHVGFWNNEAGGMYSKHKLGPDAWHHVAMVFDGKTTRFYINGTLDGEAPSHLGKPGNGRNLLIGRDIAGRYFDGLMDDLRIWSVARTEKELVADMHRELTGEEPGLAAYWTFDEGRGDVAKSVANGIHATAYRNPSWVRSTSPIEM